MDWKLSLWNLQDLQILQRLGSGGFGKVYLVRSSSFGQILVAKVSEGKACRYLKREYRFMFSSAELDIAPQVWVPPFEVTLDQYPQFPLGSQILFQTYLPGVTLKKIVETGLHPKVCKELTLKLLELIQLFHSSGMAHRDLNPSNLIWDPVEKTLKLIDFGMICKKIIKGVFCGTVLYVAPELVMGIDQYDAQKADLFAIGALVKYIWTQKSVYQIAHEKENYIRHIRNGEFDPTPISDHQVHRVMTQLTDPNPDFRISAQEALKQLNSS